MQIQVSKIIQASPVAIWSFLTNWDNHKHLVPLTKISLGDRKSGNLTLNFVATTGLLLVDPMEVYEYQEPPENPDSTKSYKMYCHLKKTGWIVKGTAGFSIENIANVESDGTALIKWWEDIYFLNKHLTKIFEPILKPIIKSAFAGTLVKIEKMLVSPSSYKS